MKIKIKIFLTFVIWGILYGIIHECGHIICMIFCGCESYEIEINAMYVGITSICMPEYTLIISVSGSLLSIIVWLLISIIKRNMYTSLTFFMTMFVEGLSWCLGGFIYLSDAKIFALSLGFDPVLFSISLLPIFIVLIYLLYFNLIHKIDVVATDFYKYKNS